MHSQKRSKVKRKDVWKMTSKADGKIDVDRIDHGYRGLLNPSNKGNKIKTCNIRLTLEFLFHKV